MWVFAGDSARFTFRVDSKIEQNDPNASSGGYMTFYDTPGRKTDYRHVVFDCRVTETSPRCDADIGLRLAAEGQAKELATYEIDSLSHYFGGKNDPNAHWKHFDVYTPDLKQVWIATGPIPGIDQDTLNKIVFFVNEGVSRRCAYGTVWIKNVILIP